MNKVTQRGYAKINLHLDITGLMDGGYHSVNTVMQSVSLCDTVTVTPNGNGEYTLACNNSAVPLDKTNLALRAAYAFEAATDKRIGGDIYIDKQIPIAGGLAGGSADAAAVLRGLNELCGYPLSINELCSVGGSLGADIPFCIVGGSAYADGKGDILHPFPALPECTVVIASGTEGVSTPAAYKMLDTLHGNFENYNPKSMDKLLAALESKDLAEICGNTFNIFEAPILSVRPVAAQIKQTLLSSGAIGAMMSGSGPSVFGIFENESKARTACEAIRSIGVTPHICKPIKEVK